MLLLKLYVCIDPKASGLKIFMRKSIELETRKRSKEAYTPELRRGGGGVAREHTLLNSGVEVEA